MKERNFDGAVYAAGTAQGAALGVFPDHLETLTGAPLPSPPNGILAPCAGYVGGFFCLAGKAQTGANAWLWNSVQWLDLGIEAYGGQGPSCAFGPLGCYVSTTGTTDNVRVFNSTGQQVHAITKPVGVQGIAAITGDGTGPGDVKTYQEWYGSEGFGYYWEKNSARIGQGATGGLVVRVFGGPVKLLEPGDWQFLTVSENSGVYCVAASQFHYFGRDQHRAVVRWFDLSDIARAPEVPVPQPIPQPPTPEPPKPEPPKPPDPVPVPTPQPMPLPPLRTAERYWFGPNIDSSDLLQCGDVDLSDVDVFVLYVQWILEDRRYDALKSSGLLKKLRAQGVQLCIEMGSIKPEDWHAENAKANLPIIRDRVIALGHEVSFIKQDEPLTSAAIITMPLEESSFAIAKFMEAAEDVFPNAKVGWIEASPHIDLETQRKCLMQLDSWGRVPAFWHIDRDWHADPNTTTATIALAKKYADDYRMPLGVYFAGYSHATDEEYQKDVLSLADGALPNITDIDHVLVQSWAVRTNTGRQDIPNNLGPRGLLETFRLVRLTYA